MFAYKAAFQVKALKGFTGREAEKEYSLDQDSKINDRKSGNERQYKCTSIPAADRNEQTNAEVKEAEKIRRSVYSILRQGQREQQPKRMQDLNI